MPSFAPSAISGVIATNRSSLNPTSSLGDVSDVSYANGSAGPWMIEEQTMNVEYWRWPRVESSGLHLNLSAVTLGLNIARTYFMVKVTASYTRRKSGDFYTSAVESRMQKFGYAPDNTDQEGVTYTGDGLATTVLPVSALGCDGTIYTAEPWYARRPWVSATDTEVSQTTVSAAYNIGVAFGYGKNEDDIFGLDYEWCSPVTNPVGAPMPMVQVTTMPGSQMTGTYDPDDDYLKAYVAQMLDTISDKIKDGLLNAYTTQTNRQVADYSKFRHDYTNL